MRTSEPSPDELAPLPVRDLHGPGPLQPAGDLLGQLPEPRRGDPLGRSREPGRVGRDLHPGAGFDGNLLQDWKIRSQMLLPSFQEPGEPGAVVETPETAGRLLEPLLRSGLPGRAPVVEVYRLGAGHVLRAQPEALRPEQPIGLLEEQPE